MCTVLRHPLTATGTGALVCTKCLQERIAASDAVHCPCCSEDGLLVSSHVRRAPDVILLLSDVMVNFTDCSRDIKAGDYKGHGCVPLLTPEEKKQAASGIAEEGHLYQS